MNKYILILLSFVFVSNVCAQVTIATSDTPATKYLGSPSIVKKSDTGDLFVSHDFFGADCPKNGNSKCYRSELYTSTNDGVNWTSLGTIDDMYWGSLFEYETNLYMIGFNEQYGDLVIRKSTNDGVNWSTNEVLDTTNYAHTAGGQPPLINDGRLWYAYEISDLATFDSNNDIKLAWVDVANDIMDDTNWSFSSELTFPSGWVGENWIWDNHWSEATVFLTPQSDLKILARVNSDPIFDYAGFVDVNSSTGALTANELVNLPGGDKKFKVNIRDGRCWTITNPNVYPVGLYQAIDSRNVVALYSSPDCKNWQYHKRLIDNSTLDPEQYGDQYVSWDFDGDDIIAAIRTGDAGANSAHDSNKINFYRWTDWDENWVGVGL